MNYYKYTKKKIRNLEKRKSKLETYKAKLKEGEKLTKDQQIAGKLQIGIDFIANEMIHEKMSYIYALFQLKI